MPAPSKAAVGADSEEIIRLCMSIPMRIKTLIA
jgi:hypothetical protein